MLIGNGGRCLLMLWKQLVVLLSQTQKIKDENRSCHDAKGDDMVMV